MENIVKDLQVLKREYLNLKYVVDCMFLLPAFEIDFCGTVMIHARMHACFHAYFQTCQPIRIVLFISTKALR